MTLSQFELAREIVVLPSCLGKDEPAADLEAAFDLLLAYALDHGIKGGLHLPVDRDRVVGAVTLQELGETVLERAADIAGVARRGAVAEIAGIEHRDAAPGARQDERRVEPGDAGADYGDVDARWRCRRLASGRRRRVPPIRCLLEVRREERLAGPHLRRLFLREADRSALSQRNSSALRASSSAVPSRDDQS